MAKTTDLHRRARAALLLGEPDRPEDPMGVYWVSAYHVYQQGDE